MSWALLWMPIIEAKMAMQRAWDAVQMQRLGSRLKSEAMKMRPDLYAASPGSSAQSACAEQTFQTHPAHRTTPSSQRRPLTF